MARIRTIKPEFWKHEDLSDLAPEVHLLAAALLNYADDEGYFRANPKLIKAECCPLREDSVSIHEAIKNLHRIGYVRLFTGSDGKAYGHITKFCHHQKINRPTPSKISELDSGDEDSLNDHGELTEGSPPERNREQGTGNREQGVSCPDGHSLPATEKREGRKQVAENFRQIYVDELGDVLPVPTKLNEQRISAANARWRDECGRDYEAFRSACQKARASAFLRGESGRGSWKGATFDWILKPANFSKVMEGNFDDTSDSKRAPFSDDARRGRDEPPSIIDAFCGGLPGVSGGR